ncbi:MAG: hypothetical protein KJO30_04600 [Boseongicola sp.]|nr:hypothetical protein [Boseongicola sp.]NNJ69475.1 hypothetical protein [Boseongicola sp.]
MTSAQADDAAVEDVKVKGNGSNWTFSVTIRHGDTGWDDYADGWRVLAEDDSELGMRTLFHPHVNEQPFTRSLSGVAIPDGTNRVFIQARTNADGWGAARYPVDLPD